MNASMLNPNRFVPSNCTESIVMIEHAIEVYFDPIKFVAIAYKGKSKKHSFYFRYKTAAAMQTAIDNWVNSNVDESNKKIQLKANVKEQNKSFGITEHFKLGEILVNSWGWEQTNIEFYKIVGMKGRTIEVAELHQEIVENSMVSHGMACDVIPTNEIIENGRTYKLRVGISKYNGTDVRISQPESYYYFHKWNGRAQYKSWYN